MRAHPGQRAKGRPQSWGLCMSMWRPSRRGEKGQASHTPLLCGLPLNGMVGLQFCLRSMTEVQRLGKATSPPPPIAVRMCSSLPTPIFRPRACEGGLATPASTSSRPQPGPASSSSPSPSAFQGARDN